MESDPIVSTAIGLLVTAALGGHETTGQVIFIEVTAAARQDKRLSAIVAEISRDLSGLFSQVAYTLGYTAAVFGDAYVRIYVDGAGISHLYVDELVRPPLVQAYERGGETVGFAVYTGERNFERLDTQQMARVKMPRIQWIPQHGIVEKAARYAISENDINRLPIMPAQVGGSLLYNAEVAYDRLVASLAGMTGQRIVDSIQESVFSLNMEAMTREQQERYVENFTQMMLTSQNIARRLVESGEFHTGRIVHGIPVWGEKQMLQQGMPLGTPRASAASIDDVMMNAKLLAGAFGVDLSMLGFADLLAGGLGEGGFFRVSAQVAERARMIRPALSECFNHIINIHAMHRYGVAFEKHEQPWEIGYYSTISALESERQRTTMDAMSSGMTLVQTLQAAKELGMDQDTLRLFLSKTMLVDEDLAEAYAKIVDAPAGMAAGGFADELV